MEGVYWRLICDNQGRNLAVSISWSKGFLCGIISELLKRIEELLQHFEGVSLIVLEYRAEGHCIVSLKAPLALVCHILYIIFGKTAINHLYTSSNGRVSEKHESQTELTTLVACTSSLHADRPMTDSMARLRTQFWNCCVNFQFPRVKASRVHLHSPLSIEARICSDQSILSPT